MRRSLFTTIQAEGGLLPSDFLQRFVEGAKDIDGLTPESYLLTAGEKPNEAASRSWNRLRTAWAAFQTASVLKAEEAGTGLTREKWLSPLFNELDASFFHLYGIPRDDTEYILGTFPIVRRNDEAAFGEYRTKDSVLRDYDRQAEATARAKTAADRAPHGVNAGTREGAC